MHQSDRLDIVPRPLKALSRADRSVSAKQQIVLQNSGCPEADLDLSFWRARRRDRMTITSSPP